MQFVRVIHPRHFDKNLKRFQSLAFKPSTSGGISVFCHKCAIETSGEICKHIEKYYAEISGTPSIFWLFDTCILPVNHSIDQSPSNTGDDCHHDIKGLTDKESARIFKNNAIFPSSFQICSCPNQRTLDIVDIDIDI